MHNFNLNEAITQLDDTIIHKALILQSCGKMAKYFLKQGNKDMALEIMVRASNHDISKFMNEEFDALSKISNDMSCMKDCKQELSQAKEYAIKIHWANNPHHPEYWEKYSMMSEIDIVEMVCDWHSRSVQYNTDLLEFVKTRNENRFKFSKEMYEKIIMYCNILLAD